METNESEGTSLNNEVNQLLLNRATFLEYESFKPPNE